MEKIEYTTCVETVVLPKKLKARAVYSAQRRRENKQKWVAEFGGVCKKCKQTFPDCVFEFHHLDHTEKEYNPSHLFHLSDSTIKKELSKCEMLCANCHRLVHEELKYDAHSKRA